MAGSLDDPWLRKQRATHQLTLLDKKPGLGFLLESYGVEAKVHREGLEYGLYLTEDVPDLDPDVPFLISEFLFNLRSALDQLVYQLHLRRYRTELLPERVEGVTAFPLLPAGDRRAGTDPVKWDSIKRLAAKERTAIKQFQPYIRRNDRLHETRKLLDLLCLLNNVDKHRRLHVAKAIPAVVPKHDLFPPDSGFRQTVFFRPLKAETEVERWTFTKPTALVDVHHEVWPQVVIDEPTRKLRINVHPALGEILTAVEKVLIRFAPLFPKDQPYWRREFPTFGS